MNALGELTSTDEIAYAALLLKIERERHMPCASYKDRCIKRRIGVRMRANKVHTIVEYAALLDRTPLEWDRLIAALTINVTRFFRDESAFKSLESQAYPFLRDSFPGAMRVWSAGCSHGQEPYSLAIGLSESAGIGNVRIDATDVDVESLAAAKAARYNNLALADVPADRRRRWFSNEEPALVDKSLRDAVTVYRHDLLRDVMPESRYHLVACRNVIIYFSREAQQELFQKLYHTLVPGGLLMLGKVETLIGPARDMFASVNVRERLFQRPFA